MSAKRRIIPVFVPHLGCPNDCVFCNQRRISGRLSPVTPEQVSDEIVHAREFLEAGRERELAFYGGSFTAIPIPEQEQLLGAALPFLNSGEITSIRLSTRPDAIDEDVLNRLERYGVETIELGAQSMCDEVLNISQRGHTAQDVRESSQLIKNSGFKLILQMMTGLPGDDDSGAEYTAREICKLKPDGVRIYPAVIIKNTELCEMWNSGEYKEHTVSDAVRVCAKIVPLFKAEGIPVIRLGLNPTDDLSGGDAVAGAYHPAFGELVYSRIMREKMDGILKDIDAGSSVVMGVLRSKISQAVGHKRCNIEYLKEKYSLQSLKITQINNCEEETYILSVAKM